MKLRQRTFGNMLANAILTPISGLIVAAGILLIGLNVRVPILDLPAITWLVGLVPVWVVAVGAKVLDRSAGEKAAAQALREEYDLEKIESAHLRDIVRRATDYRERIDQVVAKAGEGAFTVRMQDVSNQVEQWVGRIYALAQKIDAYRLNDVIQKDTRTIPTSIGQLKMRMTQERDESVKAEIANAIHQRQGQLNMLEALDATMDKAELQLENTLTALGTVYSQMLLIDARDVNSARTQRLRDNITEQMAGLNDVITSMNDVYELPARTSSAASS
ncbi:MAG: hypothetical protein KA750_01620 [Thermoflexales bacterium]|nr:hypothetical protein [Thermoflexales bacterium]